MGKANITKKRNISIKGVLDVNKEDNKIYVDIEDSDEPMSLADLLQDFDNCEISMTVGESIDLA